MIRYFLLGCAIPLYLVGIVAMKELPTFVIAAGLFFVAAALEKKP